MQNLKLPPIANSLCLFLTLLGLAVPDYSVAQNSLPLIQQLQDDLRSEDEAKQIQAVAQLGDYGPLSAPAVPELIRLLDEKELALQHEAALTLGKIGPAAESAVPSLLKLLESESLILKDGALQALRGIGPAAQNAVPKLIELLDSPDDYLRVTAARTLLSVQRETPQELRQRIFDVLVTGIRSEVPMTAESATLGVANLGTSAVPALREILQNGPDPVIPRAVEALVLIGPPAESAVPDLVTLTKSQDELVRLAAIMGLGGLGVQPKISVEAIVPKLSDESPTVRAAAANALYRFGPAAEVSLDDLRSRLSDQDETVRMAAARAIGSLGAAGESAVGDLLNAINTDTGPVALAAADALAAIGKPAVPVLAEAAQKPELRGLALAVLERIGPDAEGAVPVLGQILVGLDDDNAAQAAITIGAIGPAASSLSPVLTSLIDSSTAPRVRAASAYALGRIGAKDALPALRKALSSDDQLLSLGAAHAIAALAPDDEQALAAALPRLEEGLKNERPAVRAGVANVLGGLGPKAKQASEALRELLDDPNASVRADAAGALGRIGSPDKQSIAALAKGLKDPEARVRYASLFALGSSGKAAAELEPVIREKLDSIDPFEGAVAAWALVKIAPNHSQLEAATEKLLAVLEHPSPAVRIEAAKTLAEIGSKNPDVMKALEKASEQEQIPAVREAMNDAITKAKKNLD